MIEHGQVEFELVGNIIIYKMSGNFNEGGLLRLSNQRKALSAKLPFDRWFRIIHLADNVFSSESVLLMGEAMQQQSKDEGCVGSIVVAANKFLERMRKHHEASNNIESIYVDTLDEAVEIFKQHPEYVQV